MRLLSACDGQVLTVGVTAGCNELLFNPVAQWWRRGPIAGQIHRFLWSGAPLHYKFSMLAYMFSYCEYRLSANLRVPFLNPNAGRTQMVLPHRSPSVS